MGWTPKSFYSLIGVFQVDKLNVASSIVAFSNMEDIEDLIKIGAATPDHLMHSKRLPLFVKNTDKYDLKELVLEIKKSVDEYFLNKNIWFTAFE